MIFERHANLKYKFGNRHFWCRGYYVDTVGRNKAAIAKYIQQQLEEDQIAGQISMKEYIDPFTGKPVEEGKEKPDIYHELKELVGHTPLQVLFGAILGVIMAYFCQKFLFLIIL
mgnify:CR=1 FL=1